MMLTLSRTPLFLRISCIPCITTTRGRKSRSDPPAKSKLARIRYPHVENFEELVNVRRRYREYNAILAALRAEFKEEILRSRFEQEVEAEKRIKAEAVEHAALMAWNDEENKKALRKRIERYKMEQEAFTVQKKEAIKKKELEEQKEQQKRALEIERLQELSKSFITSENLVERIEFALDNPKSYNFCLDRNGRILPQGMGQS